MSVSLLLLTLSHEVTDSAERRAEVNSDIDRVGLSFWSHPVVVL